MPRNRLDVSRHKDVLVRYVWPLVSIDFSWFDALKQLYALFGVSVTKNPFIDGDRVDSAALLAAASR